MNTMFQRLGSALARYLTRPRKNYEQFSIMSIEQMEKNLQPGDLLLVEGNSIVSSSIKYLTQSTWSHVAMYVGEQDDGVKKVIEADIVQGVMRSPLTKYLGYNLRICRAANLSAQDSAAVVDYMLARVGYQYDTRNIVDLARYLFPTPPVPSRYRRKLLAFGSGDPTRGICSTLIAQAFQSVKYPILPREVLQCYGEAPTVCDTLLLESRHYSHFTPRDFDLSPYFEVVKPTLRSDFDYRKLRWVDDSHTLAPGGDAVEA